MPSQRTILGIGLAILLVIGAASIGLHVKSGSDTAAVEHTIGVLKKIADIRLLLRNAESAARGFGLTGQAEMVNEYRDSSEAIAPAFEDLLASTRDNPGQMRLLQDTRPLLVRRLAVSSELIRLRTVGDNAGIAALTARAEGRTTMEKIDVNLDKAVAEEQRLLEAREARSKFNGRLLLATDLAGVALILILAVVLVLEGRRSRRELQDALSASTAANESLEAAVAERTEHLITAHEELRRSTSVLDSTFQGMAEAVLVIDAEGEILLANPAAAKTLLYRPGMNVEDLRALSTVFYTDGITPIPTSERPAERTLRGEPCDGLEMVAHRLDNNTVVHVVVSGRPLRDATGAISGAAMVFHDITHSRETERKLQQSQKLDAIGKLTGGVAHDINNMLTVITGTTETLVAGLQHEPTLQKAAELIDRAAERCRGLVQHLLAFARRQPLQPRDIDVNAAVRDVTRLLHPTLGARIEINSVLEQDVAMAHIDPSQLENSVLNMAINARDAMPEGGKLLLETRNVVLDEAYAQLDPDVKPGPYVLLAVSDTGTGMSREVQDKAFEPFFTTKEVGKGSGLGLSMVYGFVKQSGGHIKIYSEEGHGTTIKLYLPPARGQIEAEASATAPLSHGTETILVVEDDTLVRNFVTTQLLSLGYKTVAVANGRAALELIDDGRPFDLLFTDVIMPGSMTGQQLAEEVKKRRPGIKVLYTSGYTDNAIVHQGRLDAGVLLLTKPYRKSQLAQMVRHALTGEAG